MTAFAQWLDVYFASFDYTIMTFFHQLALIAGGVLTPVFKAITFLGEGGVGMIVLGLVLLFFRKTRKCGVGILIALILGTLLSNVVIKNLVGRLRPFMNEGSIYGSIYASWYQQLGSQYATNYSFPSGHTMAAMAGMSVVFAYGNKRYSWLAYLYVLIMGITRIYFVVHYPTDILAGLITGGIGALAAISIVNWVMGYCAKHQEKAWCRLLTNKPEGEKASYAEN